MKSSVKIGSVMGIPIRLHITFLLILPFLAYAFAVAMPPFGFGNVPEAALRYMLGTIAAVLLFASVLLHEIGHSYVAKKNGIQISDITLYLFGGVSAMEDIPRNPRVEMPMALTGPFISIVLGVLLAIVYYVWAGIRTDPIWGTMLFLLAYLNVALGIFNLLPGFPMDGGRVLRAFLAMRMSYIKATEYAVGAGKIFAILLGLLGLLMGMHGLWLIIIAFFIYIAGTGEEQSTVVSLELEGNKVDDIMTRDVETIDASASVAALLDLIFSRKHMGYPVTESGRSDRHE
jgi:Zn-dependent protease